MQLIDSHSHIDFNDFDRDRGDAIKRAKVAGISNIIVSSTHSERWHLVKEVCAEHPLICHPAYGLHPMFMSDHQVEYDTSAEKTGKPRKRKDIASLKTWLEHNNAIAIGEIGLDFFIEEADENHKRLQLELFISQLEIANDLNLPVIIHARKSLDIVLKHLRKFPKVIGSIHSFSGSLQQANQLIDLGYYLGFGGPITYDRATRLHQLIRELPLEAILIESDSPDQPDSSHYKQRNEPAFILKVAEKIAELKELDINRVAEATCINTSKLFKLNPE